MARTGDPSKMTQVGLNTIPNYIMETKTLDTDNASGETYHYFENAAEYWGYYQNDPIVFSAANNLATWAFSKGYETEDEQTREELEHLSGRGNDNFLTLMWNHEVTKLVQGDAFMEIIWENPKKRDLILNLVPIAPERVKIVSKNGRILRYEVWTGGEWRKVSKLNMYHTSNKRIGDQIHGTSQILAIKKYLDMRNEATDDERVIKHRDKALGIVRYKTNNEGKIDSANTAIKTAIANGDMVGIPEDTAEIQPWPGKSSEDRQSWIQYLENFTYQAFGVPRSIATSDGTSEVGGKMGHVIFEPIYSKEQAEEEAAIWQQLYIKVKFLRPPSLGGLMQQTEQKNTGQLNIQPNDVTANMARE